MSDTETNLNEEYNNNSLLVHRTTNIEKWRLGIENLKDIEENEKFNEILNNTICIPAVGMYEYNFSIIFKYPNSLFDYVIPVDVSFISAVLIMIGVKNKKYYRVYVNKNNFEQPIMYELELDEYI